ncbi:hypothetical protein AB0O64_25690 [Streptomyces sp. NPDC088341]|uniref:hypothetical protein n=1 Tax=Streptomyces sp. NPDC088341 TaxID=3154870 RepID=UPI00341D0ABF
MWLSSWGAFLTAVVSAIALVFSGLATYYAAGTLSDARADDERGQAGLIGIWTSLDTSTVTVVNSSPLPVYQVTIQVVFSFGEEEFQWQVYSLPSIAPCTRLDIPGEQLILAYLTLTARRSDLEIQQQFDNQRKLQGNTPLPPAPSLPAKAWEVARKDAREYVRDRGLSLGDMKFTDASGRSWNQGHRGLRREESTASVETFPLLGGTDPTLREMSIRYVKQSPADCGT